MKHIKVLRRVQEVKQLMQKVNQFYRFIKMDPTSKVHLVFLYRYISLILTSFFFLLGPQSPFIFKTVVVLSLGIAAWIITDLQRKYLENNSILKLIVLTETLGLTFLLIPTGGISSPFIWYALNPVLVAASFLRPLFCWGVLTFFLASATLIAHDSIAMVLEEKSYFYLVCVLITLLARLFSGLTKALDEKASLLKVQQQDLIQVNDKLTETNQKYQEALDHVMSLYHLMENFASEKNAEKLTEEITSSLVKCTQHDVAFFWLTDINHQNSYLEHTANDTGMEEALKSEWSTIRGKREPFTKTINDELYLMKIIRTSHNIGVLGVKIESSSELENTFLLNRTFEFLTDLSEIMLERIHMDQMKDQMLIVEEQNRIANEIHDSVSQRLFGMAFAMHSLQVKSQKMTPGELNKEYQFLSQSINATIKELRSAIYHLSSVKKDEKPFFVQIRKYFDEFSRLNDIQINHRITGKETLISNDQKQALYRIICEACGNAARHGKCNSIDIKLTLHEKKTALTIFDDGIGIDLHRDVDGKKEKGIGLHNMQSIVNTFAGTFSIDGSPALGTEIQIEIPTINKKQEVAG
ncbi:ATP-binding protein [Virgibacillus doumboii]|uniref:ATP-binding protein n=1 Tax=Virgibacillus doumboii TaxID=2697503 RepID=UPI0013E0DB78|nr:ATP-binding protein [Virgibacillus doumboii]